MSEFDQMMAKIGNRRGPMQGWGNNGRGNPFGGIVEDTTVLWVGWVVSAAKAAGYEPETVKIAFYDVPLTLTPVEVGFGTRYYWRCPRCNRRCEAVFALRGPRVACRECLHLGYRSQVGRPTSYWYWLNQIFDGPYQMWVNRHYPSEKIAKSLATAFKDALLEEYAKKQGELLVSIDDSD